MLGGANLRDKFAKYVKPHWFSHIAFLCSIFPSLQGKKIAVEPVNELGVGWIMVGFSSLVKGLEDRRERSSEV